MIDPTQAAGAASAPGQQQPAAAGVCITPQADGTYMVGPDSADGDEATEQQNGQPAQDLDSALQLARQMLEQGQDPATADAQANDLFQAGFNGQSGRAQG